MSEITPYGFRFGPALVERVASVKRSGGTYRCLSIDTGYRELRVYISPTGRSIRVFDMDSRKERPELTP